MRKHDREFINAIHEDWKEFTRELLGRFDAKMDAWNREMDRRHADNVERLEALKAESRELVAESRAQREALLRMLDRLDGGGGAAPAT